MTLQSAHEIYKNLESDFYANGSPNDDLESEIQKGS